jgi:hypothetical protein
MPFVILRLISLTPPAIQPARTFLSKFINLLSSSDSSFVTSNLMLPSKDSSPAEVPVTISSTLNWLHLVILTAQRAPAEGVSGVQARGTTGGIPKDWESLCRRYKGQEKIISSGPVSEVSSSIWLAQPSAHSVATRCRRLCTSRLTLSRSLLPGLEVVQI